MNCLRAESVSFHNCHHYTNHVVIHVTQGSVHQVLVEQILLKFKVPLIHWVWRKVVWGKVFTWSENSLGICKHRLPFNCIAVNKGQETMQFRLQNHSIHDCKCLQSQFSLGEPSRVWWWGGGGIIAASMGICHGIRFLKITIWYH